MAATNSRRRTYAFLGAGKMGEAVLAGLCRQGLVRPRDVRVVEVSAERAAAVRRRYRVQVVADAASAVAASDVVVLAVKPQDLGGLLEGLPSGAARGRLFVSIAAGKTLEWLEARLPGARVVRVMPNLAMRVGEGMSAFCLGRRATGRDRRAVVALLRCAGVAREIPEPLFDAVTALSGSGPAFLATVLKAFVEGGIALGLPPDDALALALQTLKGTARVLGEGGDSLDEFIQAVTSARGTTAAGLAVLEKSSLAGIVRRTLRAAALRSRALSRA